MDERHDDVVAAGDAGQDAQRLVVGAVEVGDDEDEPVVGDDVARPARSAAVEKRRRRSGTTGALAESAALRPATSVEQAQDGGAAAAGPGPRRAPASERTSPPTRSPAPRMRQAASAAISAAVTDFIAWTVPKNIAWRWSTRISAGRSRSSRVTRTWGLPVRAVTFQSMARTSSPGR